MTKQIVFSVLIMSAGPCFAKSSLLFDSAVPLVQSTDVHAESVRRAISKAHSMRLHFAQTATQGFDKDLVARVCIDMLNEPRNITTLELNAAAYLLAEIVFAEYHDEGLLALSRSKNRRNRAAAIRFIVRNRIGGPTAFFNDAFEWYRDLPIDKKTQLIESMLEFDPTNSTAALAGVIERLGPKDEIKPLVEGLQVRDKSAEIVGRVYAPGWRRFANQCGALLEVGDEA